MLTKQCIEGNPRKESLSGTPTQFRGFRRNYRSGTTTVRWAILIATFACLAQASQVRKRRASRVQPLKLAPGRSFTSNREKARHQKDEATRILQANAKAFREKTEKAKALRKKAKADRNKKTNTAHKAETARIRRKKNEAARIRRKKAKEARILRQNAKAAREAEAARILHKKTEAASKAKAARILRRGTLDVVRARDLRKIVKSGGGLAAGTLARVIGEIETNPGHFLVLSAGSHYTVQENQLGPLEGKRRRLIERLVRAEVEMATSCD